MERGCLAIDSPKQGEDVIHMSHISPLNFLKKNRKDG